MTFDPKALLAIEPPDHLREVPRDVVDRLAGIIRSEFAGAMPDTLRLDLEGFERDRTVWDGQRVARALRHAYGKPGLAQEIEDALSAD